jgi:hypothetical protein
MWSGVACGPESSSIDYDVALNIDVQLSSRTHLFANIGLVDGLLMPHGGLGAFIRRQVMLPPEVVDELDRRAAKRRARSPLGRGVGVLGRYGLAATRLVRTPEMVP